MNFLSQQQDTVHPVLHFYVKKTRHLYSSAHSAAPDKPLRRLLLGDYLRLCKKSAACKLGQWRQYLYGIDEVQQHIALFCRSDVLHMLDDQVCGRAHSPD